MVHQFWGFWLTWELIPLARVAFSFQLNSSIDRPSFDFCSMNSSLGASVLSVDGRSIHYFLLSPTVPPRSLSLSCTNPLHPTALGQFIHEPEPKLLQCLFSQVPSSTAAISFEIFIILLGEVLSSAVNIVAPWSVTECSLLHTKMKSISLYRT